MSLVLIFNQMFWLLVPIQDDEIDMEDETGKGPEDSKDAAEEVM